jgi:hypothetical protein
MYHSRRKWPAALLAAPAALCLVSGLARAQTFDAPLNQCNAVTTPAALTNCASVQDPLKRGGATINEQGDVTVVVYGAAANTTYTVSFVSGDGTQSAPLGDIKTDAHGDGVLRKDAFYKFGTVGAGNVVLSNGGGEEFITGVSVSSNGLESGRDFQPALVRCTDVTVPGALSSCGSDPLNYGHVDVENDDGALSIHVSGARPATSYTAIFTSPSGGTPIALGTVGPTDSHGNATLLAPAKFPAGTIGSGSIVLQSGTTDEFVSGFKVDQKFVPPAVSVSNLVECGAVTDPNDLVCGSDPLDHGFYAVNAIGQITVALKGAEPSTNYEVYFRPLDDSGDVDTGIEVSTNSLGNAATGPKTFFPANTVASGTLVLKHTGTGQLDQFVAGYDIR